MRSWGGPGLATLADRVRGAADDIVVRMRKAAIPTALMMMAILPLGAQQMPVQMPCPVMLVNGHVRGNSIELSFRNEGKVPIQQVSLGCSPPLAGRARDAICHTESGLFYPRTQYTMEFAYTGARRGAVTLSRVLGWGVGSFGWLGVPGLAGGWWCGDSG